MGQVSDFVYGLVAGGAVIALWDAARRFIEMRVFNDREIQRIIALEYEQKQLRLSIDAVGSKLNATQAAQATRTQRIGGLR